MPGRGISQQRGGLHARCAKTGIYPSNVLERVYTRGQAAMARYESIGIVGEEKMI